MLVTEKALILVPGTWEVFCICKLNKNSMNEQYVMRAFMSVCALSGIYYLKNKQEWEACLISRELKPLELSPFSRIPVK